MGLEMEAVYENGVLRLPRSLPLTEGATVRITIHPPGSAFGRFVGLVPWQGDPEELDRWLNDPDEGQWGNHDVWRDSGRHCQSIFPCSSGGVSLPAEG
jgi:predicted DNA-binding antitoxin AbrB/MazE fold protein